MLNVTQLSGFMVGNAALEPHRYWRLRLSQPQENISEGFQNIEIREIEFRSVATGVAASTGDKVTETQPNTGGTIDPNEAAIEAWNWPTFSSPTQCLLDPQTSNTPAYQPREAFDGQQIGPYESWWPHGGNAADIGTTSFSIPVGTYIGYDFVTPIKIKEVIILVGYAESGFSGMAVDYSDDRVDWQEARNYKDIPLSSWSTTVWKVFTLFP